MGIRSDADGRPAADEDGYENTDDDGVAVHERDMADMSNGRMANRAGRTYQRQRGSTVHGVGRVSLVDLEDHDYATLATTDSDFQSYLTTAPDELVAMYQGLASRAEDNDDGGRRDTHGFSREERALWEVSPLRARGRG